MMKSLHSKRFIKASVLVILIIIGGITMAQDTSNQTQNQSEDSNKNSAEMDDLKLRQQKAETEKAISQAEKAAAEAKMEALKTKWSISDTEGRKGTITLKDSAGYYAEILAYLALEDAAKDIAVKTEEELKSGELIILGEVDLKAEKSLWNLLNLKLDLAIDKIKEAIKEYPQMVETDVGEAAGIIEGLFAAPKILGAITDIVAFFKTDYTLYGKKITLNERSLIASAANHISTQNTDLKILLPEYNLTSTNSLYEKISTLNGLVKNLVAKRETIVKQLDQNIAIHSADLKLLKVERDTTKKKLGNAALNSEEKKKLELKFEKLEKQIYDLSLYERTKEKILTPLDEDIEAAHELVSLLITKTDSTASPLEKIATIDFIHQHSKAKILYLTIASQGGEVETSDASLSHGRISYLGGVVVTYFLSDAEGLYHQSGNVHKTKTKSFKRKEGPAVLNLN